MLNDQERDALTGLMRYSMRPVDWEFSALTDEEARIIGDRETLARLKEEFDPDWEACSSDAFFITKNEIILVVGDRVIERIPPGTPGVLQYRVVGEPAIGVLWYMPSGEACVEVNVSTVEAITAETFYSIVDGMSEPMPVEPADALSTRRKFDSSLPVIILVIILIVMWVVFSAAFLMEG